MSVRRWRTLAVGAAVSMAVASCGPLQDRESADTGPNAPATQEDSGKPASGENGGGNASGDASGDEPPGSEPMTTLPPEFLECGDPTELDTDDGLMLADLDLTGAQWSTPDGFRQSQIYNEDNPVENLVDFWVAEPAEGPVLLNVVVMATYDSLDWGDAADICGRVPLEAVEERLAGYRDQIGAEPMSDAKMTLLDGHPAMTQELSLPNYDYVGYWLFSPDQLLHLYCQWTTQRDVVETGCSDLVGSLQVS